MILASTLALGSPSVSFSKNARSSLSKRANVAKSSSPERIDSSRAIASASGIVPVSSGAAVGLRDALIAEISGPSSRNAVAFASGGVELSTSSSARSGVQSALLASGSVPVSLASTRIASRGLDISSVLAVSGSSTLVASVSGPVALFALALARSSVKSSLSSTVVIRKSAGLASLSFPAILAVATASSVLDSSAVLALGGVARESALLAESSAPEGIRASASSAVGLGSSRVDARVIPRANVASLAAPSGLLLTVALAKVLVESSLSSNARVGQWAKFALVTIERTALRANAGVASRLVNLSVVFAVSIRSIALVAGISLPVLVTLASARSSVELSVSTAVAIISITSLASLTAPSVNASARTSSVSLLVSTVLAQIASRQGALVAESASPEGISASAPSAVVLRKSVVLALSLKPSALVAELSRPTSRGIAVASAGSSVVGSFAFRAASAHGAGVAVSSSPIAVGRASAGFASRIDQGSSNAEIRSVASLAVETSPVVSSAVARARSAVESSLRTAESGVSVTNRAILSLPSSRTGAPTHCGVFDEGSTVLAVTILKKTRGTGIATPELRSSGGSRTDTTADWC